MKRGLPQRSDLRKPSRCRDGGIRTHDPLTPRLEPAPLWSVASCRPISSHPRDLPILTLWYAGCCCIMMPRPPGVDLRRERVCYRGQSSTTPVVQSTLDSRGATPPFLSIPDRVQRLAQLPTGMAMPPCPRNVRTQPPPGALVGRVAITPMQSSGHQRSSGPLAGHHGPPRPPDCSHTPVVPPPKRVWQRDATPGARVETPRANQNSVPHIPLRKRDPTRLSRCPSRSSRRRPGRRLARGVATRPDVPLAAILP